MGDLVAGVEVAESGTRLVVALSPERGARHWSARLGAPPPATDAIAQINLLIARALTEAETPWATNHDLPVNIGVALAGQVDPREGVVRQVKLASGWDGLPLARMLAEHWGGPAAVLSSVQAATLAEARLGAGRGHQDVLYLSVGRTVAAGLWSHGTLYVGAHGGAGQLAHWQVRADGPRCACGARGHLDPMASAQSLVRNMIGRAVEFPASEAAMLRVSGGRAEAMTADAVARLAAAGDPVAGAVVDEALDALTLVLAGLVLSLDPEVIVLGGPLAGAESSFITPLAARLAMHCEPFAVAPPVLAARLEPVAALAGAILRAQESQ